MNTSPFRHPWNMMPFPPLSSYFYDCLPPGFMPPMYWPSGNFSVPRAAQPQGQHIQPLYAAGAPPYSQSMMSAFIQGPCNHSVETTLPQHFLPYSKNVQSTGITSDHPPTQSITQCAPSTARGQPVNQSNQSISPTLSRRYQGHGTQFNFTQDDCLRRHSTPTMSEQSLTLSTQTQDNLPYSQSRQSTPTSSLQSDAEPTSAQKKLASGKAKQSTHIGSTATSEAELDESSAKPTVLTYGRCKYLCCWADA